MKNKQKLKIVHVCSYFPPHIGGLENSVKNFTKNLLDFGYDITIFTSNIGLKNNAIKSNINYKIHYLKSFEIAHTPIIFNLLFKLLLEKNVKLIHLHVAQAFTPEIVYIVSKIRKIPYIAHIHIDADPSGKLGILLKPYKKYILSHILKNADHIICLSDSQKNILVNKYSISNKKFTSVMNGVEEIFYNKPKKFNQINPTILFVGRLVQQKNIPLLINTIKLLSRNVRVRIVGEGEKKVSIQYLIKKLELKNIDLIGNKTGIELVSEYRNADIFILTSTKEGGAPLVLLEALASKLPSVAPNIYGLKELLNDSVLLVDNPSPANLASAIESIITNIQVRRKLRNSTNKIIKEFTWKKCTATLNYIYIRTLFNVEKI